MREIVLRICNHNQQLFPKVRPKLGFSFALRMEAYLAVAETFIAFAFQRKIDFWFEMILRESTVDYFVANDGIISHFLKSFLD